MVKSLLCFAFIGLVTFGKAQNHPAFPSVAEAEKFVRSSYVFRPDSPLRKDYNVKDLSQVKLIKGTLDENNKEVAAWFSAYSSDKSAQLWPLSPPDDRCHVYFTVVTPKEADGLYYRIPLEIVYSRLENDVLTNTWKPYWIMMGNPVAVGGKQNSPEQRVKIFTDALSTIPAHADDSYKLEGSKEDSYIEYLNSMYNVESIIYAQGKDHSSSPTNQTWYYKITGWRYTERDVENWSEAKAQKMYLNCEVNMVKENGSWKIDYFYARSGGYEDETANDGKYYATMKDAGFDAVYLKKTETKPDPSLSFVKKQWIDMFRADVGKALNDIDNCVNILSKYFAPDQSPATAAEEFIKPFVEAKRKMCELKNDFHFNGSGINEELVARSTIDRPSWTWSGYSGKKAEYKKAGMSSAVVKSGAHYQGGIYGSYEMVIINGQWYIGKAKNNASNKLSKDIPW